MMIGNALSGLLVITAVFPTAAAAGYYVRPCWGPCGTKETPKELNTIAAGNAVVQGDSGISPAGRYKGE